MGKKCNLVYGVYRNVQENGQKLHFDVRDYIRKVSMGASWAKPPHFAHGPAAAALLRGEIIFPAASGKTNFPAPHFLRHPTHATFRLLPLPSSVGRQVGLFAFPARNC